MNQNQQENANSFNSNMNSEDAGSGKGATNLEEFHNRVNSLKMRYGFLLKKDNNENQGQTSSIITQSAAATRILNTNSNNMAQVAGIDAKSLAVSGTPGGSSSAKTENIMQKLSEMKQKMNSIVNAGKNNNNKMP